AIAVGPRLRHLAVECDGHLFMGRSLSPNGNRFVALQDRAITEDRRQRDLRAGDSQRSLAASQAPQQPPYIHAIGPGSFRPTSRIIFPVSHNTAPRKARRARGALEPAIRFAAPSSERAWQGE